HHSPGFSRPALHHSHPTRAVLVALAFLVPVELNLHTPVFVDPDFFPALSDNDRRLRTMNDGLRCDERRPEDNVGWNRLESVAILLLIAFHRDLPHDVGHVHGFADMLREGEL